MAYFPVISRAKGHARMGNAMRFSIYGRYDLEVVRVDGAWVAQRVDGSGPTARRRSADLVIPADLGEGEVATYLDDLLHELARPGDEIRRLD